MKKILAVIGVVLVLTGCSKKVTCAWCGEEAKGKTYTITFDDETGRVDLCDECAEDLLPWYEDLGGTVK